jgi:hypothetical protein
MGNTQEDVHDLLRNLRSLDGLKDLFRSQLSYDLVNLPISRQEWPDSAASSLEEDPVLLARHEDFHIIYNHLHGPLHLTPERNIINRLLREHPYALFVFSDDRQRHWHFVNVKLSADRDEEKNRDSKRRRLFRRISVGPDEKLRTATEQLSLLDLEAISSGKLLISPLDIQQAHDDAFDVEKVTNQFFRDYQAATQILQKDLFDQTKDNNWAHGYALQFLNRLMFLYFIQRKRWVGNNPEFIEDFWRSYQDSGQAQNTFFDKWLGVLFFEAFNDKPVGVHTHFPTKIREALALAPYLNGGLFQENGLDRKTGFTISDRRFEQIFKFLERYNFTIAEDSPLDQEVAVDPEMIGKVYESLVNVSTELDTRGDAGIFYTPRTEIDLMCRLAMVDNLANHLGEDKKNLFYELVFALVPDEKEEADRKIIAAELWGPIEQQLQALTVLDPACGSGSFLVGMLHILDDLQVRASRYLGKPEDPYERRKRIIGQNLYGVDVMEWACRVAELRLWLALIIDATFTREELHVRSEPLLPNFTFNIRQGDSLVQEVGGINLGHRRVTLEIPSEIRPHITRLKKEKLKFYRNDPDHLPADKIKHEELCLFRDILDHLQHGLRNRAVQLRQMMAGTQWRLDGTKEAVPKKEEWARELEEVTAALADMEQAQATLRDRTELPFVWDIAFVEIFEGEGHGFDIVIGNPPYVRQEKIGDPKLTLEEKAALTPEQMRNSNQDYKSKLARSVYQAFRNFFKFKAQAEAPGRKLDAKSDLYIYFYLHGLSLLNRKGSFCFITSNSWLDVGYGKDLQEFLLKHTQIKFILDNRAKRSFAGADVNTIIALFSCADDRTDWGLKQVARFVMFQVPFEEIMSPVIFEEIEEARDRVMTPEYRIFSKPQKVLWEEGLEMEEVPKSVKGHLIGKSHYIGDKWGGKYLRAPEIYWIILEKGKDKLLPIEKKLGEVVTVSWSRQGHNKEIMINRDNNILKNDKCIPVLKSPREFDGIIVSSDMAKTCLLVNLIDERQIIRTPLVWDDIRGERHICRLNKDLMAFTHNFHGIRLNNKELLWHICACLNSTLVWFFIEVLGRRGLGGGAVRMLVNDLKHALMVIDPNVLSDNMAKNLKQAIIDLAKRPVYPVTKEINLDNKGMINIRPDRLCLDNIIFDALELTNQERELIYRELIELVESRLEKADSLKPKERVKRVTAAEKTLGIWSEIPEELFEEE